MPIIMCGYCDEWLGCNNNAEKLKQVWEIMQKHEDICPENYERES